MTTNAIGIDLGTTYSCVAVYEYDRPKIIFNANGSRTTPSWVAFNGNECLIGEAAKDQASYNPENTIYDMKRLIGRRYTDSTVQSDIKNWPFKTICTDGFPKVSVMYKKVTNTFKPEEISAMILTKMKETAEAYLESKVTKAVITVPAYFSDYQRKATMDAAKIAGLDVLRLLNEPTAAAVAYVFSKTEVSGTLLVVDIGGGTLDVSIVVTEGSEFTVKATNGNTHLGGEDFTNKLIDHISDLFEKKHSINLRCNKRALCRLRHQCEIAKKRLSFSENETVCIDSIAEGIDLNENISRNDYEIINVNLFDSILETVKEAVRSANIAKEDIDKVLMVGGSSRTPKIQSLLNNFFNKPIYASINPDEAIAQGACIYAGIHSGVDIKNKLGFIMHDIIPRSLGTDMINNRYSILLKKYSRIPISHWETYTTSSDNQTKMLIEVYEGEYSDIEKNKLLGKMTLEGLPPKPEGKEEVLVTFSIDRNGILKVSAKSVSTEEEISATIDRKF